MTQRQAKLAIIDPHNDMPIDIAKSVVVVGLLVAGIIFRFRPMPDSMAGAAFIFLSVLLLVIWGKGLDRRRQRRDHALKAKLGQRPYPIWGYVDWLVGDAPTATLHFKDVIDRTKLDATWPPTWPDEQTAVVAIPPKTLGDGLHGGDSAALVMLLDRLTPIADHITSIDLTG